MARKTAPELDATEIWRIYLMTGQVQGVGPGLLSRVTNMRDFRRLMQKLPSDPRCKACRSPFKGPGGTFMRALGRRPSKLNPQLCDVCDVAIGENLGGTEIPLTMVFADVRGSTALAEDMNPAAYRDVINRFYGVVTDVLVRADALIEKLIGDEVAAMFVPGFAGADHQRRAIETAREILRATGHGGAEPPWIPVGVGVHAGTAWVGAVGREDGLNDIVALGDSVNTAARLASLAAAGEVWVSHETLDAARLDVPVIDRRNVQPKGRRDSVEVAVLRA